ncbi:MAG TPA: dTDP-4-dehydrorhamnose 3,5-epimerase [Dongiaceae bacterium]|jgi:dTDP-4-dehydrorhamnose 3,5-epimerase|nr:dTDP-4-dehydrorhamnose 3,5-epimerase [Dongiaceae bacterium]
MKIIPLPISDVFVVEQPSFGDNRGAFIETYSEAKWRGARLPALNFVQDNMSLSRLEGTVRGLHYQLGPNAQAKLISVVRGRILDIAVDIRRGSTTFGKHVGWELSGFSGQQLFIPQGFAHGFVTLEPDTIVAYKVSAPYDPPAERGIAWSDPALSIAWGITERDAVLSEKDTKWPALAQAEIFE